MSELVNSCEIYFGTKDFYEILDVEKNASPKEIKKAYYKLSLIVHPDRVHESEKEIATEKFKILSKVHSTLQDYKKRELYNTTGTCDDDAEENQFDWMDYWKELFKPISIEDIQNYEKRYIGSVTEKEDIKAAYIASEGDMNLMLDLIPFSNVESEPRIIEIVQELVRKGEVEAFGKFFHEPVERRRFRHQLYQKKKMNFEKKYKNTQL